MYESFFQFQKRPFPAAPDAGSYVGIGSIEAARDTIARCIEHGAGPALLIGPAGTGKTTLCQVLAEQFREQFAIALLASGRICSRRALLQAILFELGLPYRDMEEGELRLSLIDHVSPGDKCPNGMLLLVDEAHTLPLRLLEEIRMITNLVRDGQPRVRLVLAGGPVLEERFGNPKLESFNQRIAGRCYLESFNRDETFAYIHAQVAAAGGDGATIFPEDAMRAVYHATDGIPRLINQVADHALMLASIGRRGQLDAAGIEEAWADLQQLPVPCTAAEGAHAPAETSDVIEFGTLDGEPEDPLEDVAADPAQQLDEIERKVAQAGDDVDDQPEEDNGDFVPAGTIGPEVELVFHGPHETPAQPVEEEFEEEEVVVDRYTVVCEEDGEEEAVTERFAIVEEDDVEDAAVAQHGQSDVVQPPAADEDAIEAAEDPVVPEPAIQVGGPRHPVMPEQMPEVASIRPADLAAATPEREDPIRIATAGRMVADDRDMIVVEEAPDAPAAAAQQAPEKPRRRDYRRLFAALRQQQA